MSKEKSKNDRIKHYALIITTSLFILTALWTVYGHFAKTSALEAVAKVGIAGRDAAAKTFKLVQEQFHIAASDSDVSRQKGNLERARDRVRFKKNDESPTAAEEEDVKLEEEELQRVIKKRDELVEQYRSEK